MKRSWKIEKLKKNSLQLSNGLLKRGDPVRETGSMAPILSGLIRIGNLNANFALESWKLRRAKVARWLSARQYLADAWWKSSNVLSAAQSVRTNWSSRRPDEPRQASTEKPKIVRLKRVTGHPIERNRAKREIEFRKISPEALSNHSLNLFPSDSCQS